MIRDEKVIREYIRNQEHEDKRLDQSRLWRQAAAGRWPNKFGAALATPDSRFDRLTN